MPLPKLVIDIRPPRASPLSKQRRVGAIARRPKRFFRAFRVVTFAVLGGLFLGGVFYGFGIWSFTKNAGLTTARISAHFESAGKALMNFDPAEAEYALKEMNAELAGIADTVRGTGLTTIAKVWGQFSPKVKALPGLLEQALSFGGNALGLTEDLTALKQNTLPWILGRKGHLFRERLEHLADTAERILALGATLKTESKTFGIPLPDTYLGLIANFYKHEEFLRAFIAWLGGERHLLILFQNPSEIRPAGGFLGSYADLALQEGSVTNLRVWDVYDPDGQLERHVVPPKQLQGVTPAWGARDANWFADFPASAGKIIEFIETSRIYREELRTFDGAIAVNTAVIQDLLDLTGPLKIPEYSFTITGDNFLEEVQREVEAGKDKLRGEPKRILKTLTPLLLDRLGNIPDGEKPALFKVLLARLERKDIMIFMKDPALESYLKGLHMTGDIAELPLDFTGEYLAVINANVGGGKSDAVMKERVKLSSKIEGDGTIGNFLIIERTHGGAHARDPWYRATNRNYLKVLTPRGSKLEYVNGNTIRTVRPSVDYLALRYAVDPDLKAIEDSAVAFPAYGAEETQESGKTAFGAWFPVEPGATRTLELEYRNPTKLDLAVETEIPYEFIFETQPGVRSALEYLIEAPPGYRWKETQQHVFNYENEDPPARLRLRLTLVPIP